MKGPKMEHRSSFKNYKNILMVRKFLKVIEATIPGSFHACPHQVIKNSILDKLIFFPLNLGIHNEEWLNKFKPNTLSSSKWNLQS